MSRLRMAVRRPLTTWATAVCALLCLPLYPSAHADEEYGGVSARMEARVHSVGGRLKRIDAELQLPPAESMFSRFSGIFGQINNTVRVVGGEARHTISHAADEYLRVLDVTTLRLEQILDKTIAQVGEEARETVRQAAQDIANELDRVGTKWIELGGSVASQVIADGMKELTASTREISRQVRSDIEGLVDNLVDKQMPRGLILLVQFAAVVLCLVVLVAVFVKTGTSRRRALVRNLGFAVVFCAVLLWLVCATNLLHYVLARGWIDEHNTAWASFSEAENAQDALQGAIAAETSLRLLDRFPSPDIGFGSGRFNREVRAELLEYSIEVLSRAQ